MWRRLMACRCRRLGMRCIRHGEAFAESRAAGLLSISTTVLASVSGARRKFAENARRPNVTSMNDAAVRASWCRSGGRESARPARLKQVKDKRRRRTPSYPPFALHNFRQPYREMKSALSAVNGGRRADPTVSIVIRRQVRRCVSCHRSYCCRASAACGASSPRLEAQPNVDARRKESAGGDASCRQLMSAPTKRSMAPKRSKQYRQARRRSIFGSCSSHNLVARWYEKWAGP